MAMLLSCLLNVCVSSLRLFQLLTLVRGASFWSGQWLMWRLITSKSYCWMLSLNRTPPSLFFHTRISRPRDIWKRRWKDCKSGRLVGSAVKHYLDWTWPLHSWTHSSCGYLHRIKPADILARMGGKRSKALPLTEVLLAVGYWEMGNDFS